MKSRPNRKPAAPARVGWLLPLTSILGLGVLGAGVAGLVLNQRNTPPPPAAPGMFSPPAPNTESNDAQHEPPPSLTLNMSPAQAALTLGNWYFDHKNWPQAIAQYQTAIKSGADNADVRTDLGSAYRFAKQPKQALEQYRRAQQMNPRHENSLFNQGGLYHFELNDQVAAVARWREYLQKFPQGKNVEEARQLIEQTQRDATPQRGGK